MQLSAGGHNNTATNLNATVGGGKDNTASGSDATVPGGSTNTALGNLSFAAGFRAKANHQGSFVWADSTDVVVGGTDFASTGNDQFLIRASGGVGIGTNAPAAKLHVNGTIRLDTLGVAGSTPLCHNGSNQIATCSSSARYKSNISSFSPGLELIRKLRPVSFNWKDGGMSDMGLVAEEVNAVEPLLTTTNSKGEIEGVKYDRVGVVLVSAVQEQQRQIEKQQKQIEQQRKQIESLTKIVCATNSTADICRQ